MNKSSFTILSHSKSGIIEKESNKEFQFFKSEVPGYNRKLSIDTPEVPINSMSASSLESPSIIPESRACVPNVYKPITYKEALDELNISENIVCKRIDKSPMFLIEKPIIIVDKPQLIKKSLFSSKQTIYNIRAVNFNTIVQRTFEDFLWLKSKLSETYPNSYVRE